MSTLLRPSNLFGPFDKFDPKKSKVIAAQTRRFADGEDPMLVWGDGNDVKDFLFITDFVDGFIRLIQTDCEGPVNICSSKKTTVKDIIVALKELTKTSPKLNFDDSKPSMIPYRVMDNSKMVELTGWLPHYSLREGLEQTLNWYKENSDVEG